MNTLTKIKRLALALCLATPFVSQAAGVGDTISWTNADGLTADDVVNANHCSFSLLLPGTESLPAGSVVRITNVQIASINSERVSNSSDNRNDPHSIAIGATRSSEVSFITSETLAGKYIDSYTFSNGVEVEVGKEYGESWGAAYTQFAGCGVTFLHSNGNRWSGGSTMNCTVGGTSSGVIANGGTIFPIYKITAEVVSIRQDIEVSTDMSASAINAMIGENATDVYVTVADGVTITIDDAFATEIKSFSSTGTVTLSAETQPDLSGIAFDVQGALLRSWLAEPGVAGINFRSASGNNVSGALATCENWIQDNNSANGSSTALFSDGLTKITWTSANTWSSGSGSMLSGYLDDGNKNYGNDGARVSISNVPYETYDIIIYCNSDQGAAGSFYEKTVNGKTYTWDSTVGAVVEGVGNWGRTSLSIPVYGVNAMRIKNLTGPLSIYGGQRYTRDGAIRGCIAAIQIMPPDTPDNIRTYKLTLDGTATTWSQGTWTLNDQSVEAPTAGYVEVVASASTEVTVDTAVSIASLTITGGVDVVVSIVTNGVEGSSFSTIGATVAGGVFKQGVANSVTGLVKVEDGATFDMNGLANGAAQVIAGAGAGSWPWALGSSSGQVQLSTPPTLTGDAAIGGAGKIVLGASGGATAFPLGGFTLTKSGTGELYCYNVRTDNGTLDVAGGTVSFNQWTALDGSETFDRHTTVIVRNGAELKNNAGRRLWIDTLNVEAGATVTTTASGYFGVATAFNGTCNTTKLQFNDGAVATLSGDLNVTTLVAQGDNSHTTVGSIEFALADGTAAATVTDSGTITAVGSITVGNGVTFRVGDIIKTGAQPGDKVLSLNAAENAAINLDNATVNGASAALELKNDGVYLASDTYDVTGSETLDSTGSFTVPAGTTKIKIGAYDVTAGFRIDGTTATLLAPEIVEETNKKAIDVGATTVTLNVELVPGLYYGVASGTGLTLTRPETLTQYTGSNDAGILAVAKPSTEKGFFKVFVDIKE